ncbi:alpha/beta fold hydrolase [Catalinimonas niigatensis]|uniref:alpha/beta fold hydrolase n=1 Tax=Catalinimonas niigatensis TaxID=1397264 RepID=UPI0026661FCB|nr:alpha/beta fold hydrolase [Catalinimonas niigatensis]WPP53496.1 alpha/beta fold hydrolase [Catalinimonas niigatensis]
MELHYRSIGEGQPMIILHGVFGTSDNLQTFGKLLAEDYQVYLLDQRNHGSSPHSEDFNYQVMAEDLYEFIKTHQLEKPIILGHSMGGKVAMFFATQYPDQFGKLIVVDIAPRAYPVHHQKILQALGAVKTDQITSRKEAEEQMEPYISDFGVRQFLLKNLKRTDDNKNFAWKLNLSVIRDNIENIGEGIDDNVQVNKPVLFVKGAKSDYIKDEDEKLIKSIFPSARIVTIKNAGHWVHAEQPEQLFEEVSKFLKS